MSDKYLTKGSKRVATHSRGNDVFLLEPAGRMAVGTLFGIAVFLDILAVVMLVTGGVFTIGTVIGLLVILSVSSLFFLFAVAQRSSRIVLNEQELHLQVPLYGRRIPLASINSSQARPVNNLASSPYQLKWRRNGLGVPGYSLGWFSSQGKGRILASVTTSRALAIPTRDDYTLLVSAKDPDALTRRLRELA